MPCSPEHCKNTHASFLHSRNMKYTLASLLSSSCLQPPLYYGLVHDFDSHFLLSAVRYGPGQSAVQTAPSTHVQGC